MDLSRIHEAIVQAGVLLLGVRNLHNGQPLQFIRADGSQITTDPDLTTCTTIAAKGECSLAVKDGSTPLADNAEVEVAANGAATKTLTIQYKNANGTDGTGASDEITLDLDAMLDIDKLSGTLDGNGRLQFTVGPSTRRGRATLTISTGPLPVRTLKFKFV